VIGRHSRAFVDPQAEAVGRAILDAAFRVHNALGPALKEKHYLRCMAHSLEARGHTVVTDLARDVHFEGIVLAGALEPDLVVDDSVIVELKASLAPIEVHDAQLLSYLMHTGITLGYVLNFRVPHMRDGIRRFVNTPVLQT
jgi:GxxExxY protein